MKRCKRCKTPKPKVDFCNNKTSPDGLNAECRTCAKERYVLKRQERSTRAKNYYNRPEVRETKRIYGKRYREINKESLAKKDLDTYRSFTGYASELFYKVIFRVKHQETYKAREICFTKTEFLTFILNNPEYKSLHAAWVASGYDKKLSPSVDRVDNEGHYTLANIQIITKSANTSKENLRRKAILSGKNPQTSCKPGH